MIILCLVQVRNEERHLPGFLGHLAPHVDGIVALDDASTDGSFALLQAHPNVVSVLRERRAGADHGNEGSNRHRLIVEAARLGADWVLCADADERFEERFLRRLRRELWRAEFWRRPLGLVKSVNLWDRPDQYRLDGPCGPRWTARLFRMPPTITRRAPGMHQPWFPPELDGARRAFMRANVYHFGMLTREDRIARHAKFTRIDPDRRHQPIGYDHLVDEMGLTLRRIPPRRAYRDGAAAAAPGVRRPASGSLADPVFAQRFHVDEDGPLRAAASPPLRAPVHPGGALRSPAAREWPHLRGFDFDAIFAQLRTGR